MINNIKNKIKDWKLKKYYKMYDNPMSEECYNLNSSITRFLIPRLIIFKEEAKGVIKYDFSKIDKIINTFELLQQKPWLDDEENNLKLYNEIYKPEIEEGMKIFKDEFFNLWW